jgi:hypothetical protein
VTGPEPSQRDQHALVTAVGDDLDPGVVGADIDLGERQKARAALQVPRADQIDLDHVAGALGPRRRVRHAL